MEALYPVKIYYDESDHVYYVDVRDFGLEGEKLTYGPSYITAHKNAVDALNLLVMNYESEHNGASVPGSSMELLLGETYIYVNTEEYKSRLLLEKEKTS